MKKILFLGLAFSLFACKNNDAASDASADQAVETAVQTTTEDLIDSTTTQNNAVAVDNTSADKNSIMYSNSKSVYNTTPTTTIATPVTVAKGMNPSHGQPGHRCDIAVGAPLNSKPASNNAATSTTITSAGNAGTVISNGAKITTTNNNAPMVTAEGMNPPHGQDGHRCDLAVGAPLNSAAVPTVANETKE